MRDRYNKALVAFNAFRSRYLKEHPDDIRLPRKSDLIPAADDVMFQDAPEAIEFSASKGQLESYVSKLRSSADTISDLFSNLILKIKTTEQAPLKREKFNELRDVFVKAEAKERDHKLAEADLKGKLEAARARSVTIKQEIERLNTQLRSSSEVVSAQKQKYDQLLKQQQEASAELEKARQELAQVEDEGSASSQS